MSCFMIFNLTCIFRLNLHLDLQLPLWWGLINHDWIQPLSKMYNVNKTLREYVLQNLVFSSFITIIYLAKLSSHRYVTAIYVMVFGNPAHFAFTRLKRTNYVKLYQNIWNHFHKNQLCYAFVFYLKPMALTNCKVKSSTNKTGQVRVGIPLDRGLPKVNYTNNRRSPAGLLAWWLIPFNLSG